MHQAVISVALEREACARTCVELTVGADCSRDWICGAHDCAIAIRARSTVLSVCRMCGGGMARGKTRLSGWSSRMDFPAQEGGPDGVNILRCPACGFSAVDL